MDIRQELLSYILPINCTVEEGEAAIKQGLQGELLEQDFKDALVERVFNVFGWTWLILFYAGPPSSTYIAKDPGKGDWRIDEEWANPQIDSITHIGWLRSLAVELVTDTPIRCLNGLVQIGLTEPNHKFEKYDDEFICKNREMWAKKIHGLIRQSGRLIALRRAAMRDQSREKEDENRTITAGYEQNIIDFLYVQPRGVWAEWDFSKTGDSQVD